MYYWIREENHDIVTMFGCPRCCDDKKVDGEAFGPILEVRGVTSIGKGKTSVRGYCSNCKREYFINVIVSYSWLANNRIF